MPNRNHVLQKYAAPYKAVITAILLITTTPQTYSTPEKMAVPETKSVQSKSPGHLIRTIPVIAALDTDQNGELSAKEIDSAASALKTLDLNKNGKLERREFQPINSPSLPRLAPLSSQPLSIAGNAPSTILKLLGAKGKEGVSKRTLENHHRAFNFTDRNRDGSHSRKEYVDEGRYLTRISRFGIFQASDTNSDGMVSREEYVMNRVITDEAKVIFDEIDDNQDRQLTAGELISSGKIKERQLAKRVFHAMDGNQDKILNLSEYLHTWGTWARIK